MSREALVGEQRNVKGDEIGTVKSEERPSRKMKE